MEKVIIDAILEDLDKAYDAPPSIRFMRLTPEELEELHERAMKQTENLTDWPQTDLY